MVKDKEGVVTCVDGARHNLHDGTLVRISEVEGMTEINGKVTTNFIFLLVDCFALFTQLIYL